MGQCYTQPQLPLPSQPPSSTSPQPTESDINNELQTILTLDKTTRNSVSSNGNCRVFVISSVWVRGWLKYVALRDGPRPGPVDNHALTTLVEGLLEPLQDLRLEDDEGGDFRIVNKEVWDEWIGWYGGGPCIMAESSEEGKDPEEWMIIQQPLSRSQSPVGGGPVEIENISIGRLNSIGINTGALEVLKERTRKASESKILEESALLSLQPSKGGKVEEMSSENTNTTEGSSEEDEGERMKLRNTVPGRSLGGLTRVASKTVGFGADSLNLARSITDSATKSASKIASTAVDNININIGTSSRQNSTEEPEGWRQHHSLKPQPSDVLMMRESVNWLFDGAEEEERPALG